MANLLLTRLKKVIKKMHKNTLLSIIIVLAFSYAQSQVVIGHYGAGTFGLRSGLGSTMGWSYLNVTHLYYAGEIKDNNGNISTLAKPINVIANISGVSWGRKLEKFKTNYNSSIILPLTNLAPNPETLELDPEKIGLGDIMASPLSLTWNFNRVSFNTRYAIWIPTGSFDSESKNNKGKGFWSHNIGLGSTVYLDKAKTWNISWMNTFEFNSKQKTTNITPPSTWVSEWGIGKTFDNAFNIGVIGYNTRQISDQKGGDIPKNGNNYRINAIGMEFNYRTKRKSVFITRWYLEYLGINRPEGTVIRFIFLKNF